MCRYRCHWWTRLWCFLSRWKLHQEKTDNSKAERQNKTKEANEMRRRNDENLLISAHYSKHCITKTRSLRSSLTNICKLHFPHFPSFRFFILFFVLQTFSFGWLFALAFFNFVLESGQLGMEATNKSLIDYSSH